MPQSLFDVARASRSGAEVLTSVTLPAEDGVIVTSLDVNPSQRGDPTRVVEFSVEVLIGGTWETLAQGRWQGDPLHVDLTPTEEFPMVAGGFDLRGAQARWRFTIPSGSVNVGGSIEHFTLADIDAQQVAPK
jgi:hypothetical protein